MSPTWYLPHNSRVLTLESMWISKHARPDDRLLASSPAGLYLHTGLTGCRRRRPRAGLRRRFSRCRADSSRTRSGTAASRSFSSKAPDDLNRDVGVVQRACPNAFHMDAQGTGGWPTFLRVVDPVCIARAFQ